MRKYQPKKYQPILTAKRREWLEKIEHDPTAHRQGKSGFECANLGWSEWLCDSDGNFIGETLTDKGRAVLNAAKEERLMPSVIVSRMRSNLILNLNYTFKIPWDQMAAYDKIEALQTILEDLSREASDLAHEAQALKGW